MEITVASHGGFCSGVKRAVETALSHAGQNLYILGELIHNPMINGLLREKGIRSANSLDEIADGATVLIRSHGEGKATYDEIARRGLGLLDATCVFVKNIHNIVAKHYAEGWRILIAGDASHPEVRGINGWCENSAAIVSEAEDTGLFAGEKICVVAQTTFSGEKYIKIIEKLGLSGKKTVEIFDTICYTTIERRKEAEALAKTNDAVVVLGGRKSSNTCKLREVCERYCPNVVQAEYPHEIDYPVIKKFKKIALVAGASTPNELIEEVRARMEQNENAVLNAETNGEVTETVSAEAVTPVEMRGTESVVTEAAEAIAVETPAAAGTEAEETPAIAEAETLEIPAIAEAAAVETPAIAEAAAEETPVIAEAETVETPAAAEAETVEIPAIAETPAPKKKKKPAAKAEASDKKVSAMDRALSDMDANVKKYRVGDVLKATVALAGDEGLSLAIGNMKKEIELGKDEIEPDGGYDKAKYMPGDMIEVMVTKLSPLTVSRKECILSEKDDALIEDIKNGAEFIVTINGSNKGGLTAKFGTFTVFIPASLIRMGFVKAEEFDKYNGKEIKLRLVEVKGKTIIASAKDIILEERKRRDEARAAAVSAFFDSIEIGQVVEGRVVRFTDFGAFVNVNGFDCLAHISDLAWTNVKKAEDVLEREKTYEFVVLKLDTTKQHVSIGYKQLQPKPWDLVADKYPAGSVVKGKVVRIAPFGAFVEVEPGIDGLVHVSQVTHDWIENPASVLKVGDEVDAMVIEVKPEAQKLTLSIKALLQEPENVIERPRRDGRDTRDDSAGGDRRERRNDRKPRLPRREDEGPREWSENKAGSGASIGDLLGDFNIDITKE